MAKVVGSFGREENEKFDVHGLEGISIGPDGLSCFVAPPLLYRSPAPKKSQRCVTGRTRKSVAPAPSPAVPRATGPRLRNHDTNAKPKLLSTMFLSTIDSPARPRYA